MRIDQRLAFTAGLMPATLLLLLLMGCHPRPVADPLSAAAEPQSWQCRNDLEVRCDAERCEAETGDGFTPMSVSVDDSGAMSVCAYSGCWEGAGEVLRSGQFLVLVGHDLEFSTSPDPKSAADIVVAIDREDGVATLKVGEFAHPLLCQDARR